MKAADEAVGAIASRRLSRVAAAAGAILLLGFLFEPRRAWTGWLIGFVTLVELSLAGVLFLALLELAGARWADALRQVPAAMSRALPLAAAAGLVLLFGLSTLYEWARAHPPDELLERKAAWLNATGFALRLVGCFVVWLLFAAAVRRRLGTAVESGASRAGRLKLAAGFVAVFALTWSLASVDWIESLEARWSSSVFALRTATGLVVSGVAAATILVVLLRDHGVLRGRVTLDHVHDLGRLLLSFTILWVYVWYCQYMLIWYTDIPEEAAYYARRTTEGWRVLTWSSLVLGFALPFVVLLLWRVRRSPAALLRVSLVLLAAQALDLYVLVGPALAGPVPALGLFELSGFAAGFALFFACAVKALAPRKVTSGPAAA